MSALASAYTSTFRPVQPLQGAIISELAASILGSQPMETARLQAGLMNTGLGAEGRLIDTTLTNRQRTKELQMEITANEKTRKDQRRSSLIGTLLQGVPALGGSRSGARDWALGQIAQDTGDGMTRAANRWGVGQTVFQGAQALNSPAIDFAVEAYRNSGKAGAGLPLPTS